MKIYQQSVFEKWEIEDKSVQAIITSPPYYSLRKYSIPDVIIGGDKDCKHEWGNKNLTLKHKSGETNPGKEGWFKDSGASEDKGHQFCTKCNTFKGQHGLEPSFKLYLSHCKLWMQEAIRVLRNDGVIFVNLGDSYGGSCQGWGKYGNTRGKNSIDTRPLDCIPSGKEKPPSYNQSPKSKFLIPERFSIMCVDELGLILRNHIVWYKPNSMPESVTDRFSKKWESIFMFVKQPKYYFNLDAIREPHAQVSIERLHRAVSNNNKWVMGADGQTPHNLSQPRPNRNTKISKEDAEMFGSPRARYHRQSETEKICIDNGYDPNGICGVCGRTWKRHASPNAKDRKEGLRRLFIPCRTRLVNPDINYKTRDPERHLNHQGKNPSDVWSIPTQPSPEKHFAMWPEDLVERMILCSTKAGDVVLDPFCGSGTTLRVADRLNRVGCGIDLGYEDISSRRLRYIQKELILDQRPR